MCTQYVYTKEVVMRASILDLRRRMAEVLRALERNEPVVILYRGREKAILLPKVSPRQAPISAKDHAAFGMWSDREDMKNVAAYVQRLRKGRFGAA